MRPHRSGFMATGAHGSSRVEQVGRGHDAEGGDDGIEIVGDLDEAAPLGTMFPTLGGDTIVEVPGRPPFLRRETSERRGSGRTPSGRQTPGGRHTPGGTLISRLARSATAEALTDAVMAVRRQLSRDRSRRYRAVDASAHWKKARRYKSHIILARRWWQSVNRCDKRMWLTFKTSHT